MNCPACNGTNIRTYVAEPGIGYCMALGCGNRFEIREERNDMLLNSTRKIEIESNHPDLAVMTHVAAEVIADELDRIGITWRVTVTDAVGIKIHEWEGENG